MSASSALPPVRIDVGIDASDTPEGVRVEITHDLDLRWPLIGGFVAKYIVGLFFIHHIATKTLAGLKRKVESMHS